MTIKDLIDVLEFSAPIVIMKNFSCETIYNGLTTDLYEMVHFSNLLNEKVKRISARDTTIIISI